MKRLIEKLEKLFADAALLEAGVFPAESADRYRPEHESLEENFIEVAFAEAADYGDIHEAIIREHRAAWEAAHPDGCGQSKNSLCFV
jgi:hypothetical protein